MSTYNDGTRTLCKRARFRTLLDCHYKGVIPAFIFRVNLIHLQHGF